MSDLNLGPQTYPSNQKLPTWDGSDGQVGLDVYSDALKMDLVGRCVQ